MLTVRVQHHPSRTALLPRLLAGLDPLSVEVIGHASDPPNPWRGYQLALESGLADPTNPSHVLVIQDDTLVCRNFPLAVERVVQARPDVPICLFLGGLPRRTGLNARRAIQRRQHFATLYSRDFMPAVAVLWPVAKAREMLAWTKTATLPGLPDPRSDDAVLGRWMLMTRQLVLVTVPSLVQHPDDTPSIIGRRAQWGRDKGRVALFYCEGDPLEYEWK